MKIFQVVTLSELGGAQSVVINLANKLSINNSVIVIAGGSGEMWNCINNNIIKIPIKQLVRRISPLLDFIVLLKLVCLYRKYKPDIIHLHSSKIGILGRVAFPSKKIIYTVHGFDSNRVRYRKYLPIERFLKNRAKAIVAVSNYDQRNLISEGIKNNVFIVYNGLDAICKNELLNYPHDDNRKVVLCIARLDPPKRFDLFLEVARFLPQYNFIWIGNKRQIDNLPENVKCLGEIPFAKQYYSISDICILLSDYEGLPVTIIEAMSYGKPVVASNVGGIPEIVSNDKNGYVVDNDPIIFANKISFILENQDVYNCFANYSLKTFQENLTIEKMLEGYLRIYSL